MPVLEPGSRVVLRLEASGFGLSEATWLTLDIRVREENEQDDVEPDDMIEFDRQ